MASAMANRSSVGASSSLRTSTGVFSSAQASKRTRLQQLKLQDGLSALHPEKEYFGSPVKTWKKILPLAAMFFCILFNYTILRDTKDALVVTAPGSGAEIIPFLKTWVNLPLAMLFTTVYSTAANYFNIYQLFYGLILIFITFFAAFAFVIYPNANLLHPTQWCQDLLGKVGDRWFAPIAIIQNWTFCAFYVMAELWGSVVISVLFWGFANAICVVKEAQQFYSLFGLVGNIALVFSGQTIRHFSNVRAKVPEGVDGWGVTLRGIMSIVFGLGIALLALREYVERTTVRSNKAELPTSSKKEKPKKAKMSTAESFKFIAQSTYIRCIAVLVIAYGIAINIVEVTWKSKLKTQYPNPNDYTEFMGNFSTVTGATTFTLMLVARWILQKKSWGFAASIPPVVLGITGVLFFSLILFGGALDPMLAGMSITPLFAAVMVGAAQNVFSKGSKYSLFDPCKEMAYIPLDDELKTKGKAAVDVIGNPLGKSGGALIQQVLIVGFGSLAASTPYLGIILLAVIVAWLKAVQVLSGLFEAEQAKREREDAGGEAGGAAAAA